MVAGHRLVVRGSHDDTHRISRLQILGVVGIESPAPHGRPQEVTLQTQNQFKDLGIKVMVTIVGAKSILHPCCQTRSLVVQEQATELDGRFTIGKRAGQDAHIVALCHGNIHPPIPGRHTHLARQFVDAEHRTTTITTGNNYLSVNGGNDEFLALTLQVGQFTALYPLVNLLVATYRTNEDGTFVTCRGTEAHHTLEVIYQTCCGNLYGLRFRISVGYSGTFQCHCPTLVSKRYKSVCCT